ncbi:DUF3817 domain-containing protein [Corynebacterium breve]|uniref:DUF3817 domain-containing protein n=1 Tax=Corynebacterium breve TaxID=3049799 RepID=A0ABY8VH06_9CORY|nr:DUF3817 domain-containing protein [Corynebacterium breve]WIM68956.1 DUF3817 domain-containing protein [Corynebacterium breve]
MTGLTPKKLHLAAGILEFFTWTLLIVGMVLKYSGTTESVISIAGGIHGFGFLCFVILTILVWVNNKWSFGLGLVGLIVSVIPWAALAFTLWADKKGKLEGGWRFSDPAEQPTNLPDKILAQAVRHPIRSLIIALIIVALVFTLLVTLGQPYDPDAVADRIG